MGIKKICIIANYYPTDTDPIYSFLDEVVCEFADNGVECHVITPLSTREKKHLAHDRVRTTKNGNQIHIYCPRYYLFPSRKIGSWNTVRLTGQSYYRAAYKTFRKHVGNCDMLYAHFLNLAGIAASMLGKKVDIPCVVACGESSFEPGMQTYNAFRKEIGNISGFVTVSTQIHNQLKKLGFLKPDGCVVVLPNGADLERFHPMDKQACRKELGLPEDKRIIGFVGHFIERKGIAKVIHAVNALEDIYALFVGDKQLPQPCEKALFVGKVKHDLLPVYLNACDAFVLPTQNEGCCNAIVEAQACGLPIITSDAEFNYDILDKASAILIDPDAQEEITGAIRTLLADEEKQQRLHQASVERAQSRGIHERACGILRFMERWYV